MGLHHQETDIFNPTITSAVGRGNKLLCIDGGNGAENHLTRLVSSLPMPRVSRTGAIGGPVLVGTMTTTI